jgi:hypothetical protein
MATVYSPTTCGITARSRSDLRPGSIDAGAGSLHQEIAIAARLSHPHIPPYDSGAVGGHLFYVMPYILVIVRQKRAAKTVDGRSLAIIRQVASALDYAHAQHLVPGHQAGEHPSI